MAEVFDLMTSMIIGSLVVIMTLTALDAGVTMFYNYNSDAISQEEIASLAEIIQYDLRKVGYGLPELEIEDMVLTAQHNQLKFIAHLNKEVDFYANIHGNLHTDNVRDTVEYIIQAADTLDYIDTLIVVYDVMRTVKVSQENIESGSIGRIVNDSAFVYLDQMGNEVSVMAAIKMVEVTLIAFNPNIVFSTEFMQLTGQERIDELNNLLRESYWRQTRVLSRNLRR